MYIDDIDLQFLDSDLRIRCEAAGRSDEALWSYAADTNAFVRQCVARNPAASARILRKLSLDSYEEVVVHVAMNQNTPRDAIAFLATHRSAAVRVGAASHPQADVGILSRLLRDPNMRVQREALNNPNAPRFWRILAAVAN